MVTKATSEVRNQMLKVLQQKFIPQLYQDIKNPQKYKDIKTPDVYRKIGIPDIEDYVIHWEHVLYDDRLRGLYFDSVGIGSRGKNFNERLEINACFYLKENKIGYNYKLKSEGNNKIINTMFIEVVK
jgi:hypothetical protein